MGKLLAVYWKHAKGIQRFAYYTIFLHLCAYTLQEILRPYAFKRIIDAITGTNGAERILYLVLTLCAVQVVAQVCFRIGELYTCKFELRHMKILRNAVLTHLLRHSSAFFAGRQTGAIVTKQKRFVSSAEALFDLVVDQYVILVVQVVGIVAVLCFISLPIAFGMLVWMLLYFGYIALFLKKRMRLDTEAAEQDSRVTGMFADIIGNISIVKMFGTSRRERKRFEEATVRQHNAIQLSWNFAIRQSLIHGFLSILLTAGGISAGVFLWTKNMLTPGELVLISMYTAQFSNCLGNFSKSVRKYIQAVADAQEMLEIIEQTPDILDAPGAIADPRLEPRQASVAFHNVTFGYIPGTTVFKDFSLHIPARQKIAVVGSSGAGKTTLIQMLLRNVDIQNGSINIGHYNIAKDVTQDGLKSLISCVSQNIDMFNRNIKSNIGYGKEEATEEEITDAAKRARIHGFIETLDKGYLTKVGERGIKLSGGQRQRVAIARALVHNAPILIFDEATSSLDNITEKEIQSILENGLKDKTVIVIAHRLSTIKNCDRILVLDDGKIIQDGSHETLLKDTNGMYYKMQHSHEIAVQMHVQEEIPAESKN
ncbi:MAG: ABC transporter ATP-binding protein [bacterium]